MQFQNLTLEDFAWQKTTVIRKPPINLNSLGIAPGAQLDFCEDSETLDEVPTHCIVTDNNKVIYAGEMLSLSAVALKVLHASGAKTNAVNGALYWAYKMGAEELQQFSPTTAYGHRCESISTKANRKVSR